MKKLLKLLLLIVFKIAEIAAYVLFCYLVGLFAEWTGILDWVDGANIYLLYIIGIIGIIIVAVWVIAIFKDWIELNKKWVDKLISKP